MYEGAVSLIQRDDHESERPGGLAPRHVRMLRQSGRAGSWARGEVIMREGEIADRAVLLESGLVKITAEAGNGYTSLLAVRGAGELIGEMGCVDGRPRGATVTAMRQVNGVVISAEKLCALLAGNGPLALDVLRSVSSRLRDSDGRRTENGAHTASGRVARVLLDLALRHGGLVPGQPRARSVTVTQHELAGACSTSRESVVRSLRTFQKEGLIAKARGVVLVLDPPGLAAWTQDTVG